MRIGIDVGGTHTDAVLIDGEEVVDSTKVATTPDIASGLGCALDQLVDREIGDSLQLLAIGTTQFTNAIVERAGLSPVAAVRLCAPAGRGLVPRMGWPQDIAAATDGGAYVLAGGSLADGRPVSPVKADEFDQLVGELLASGTQQVAIAAAYAHLFPEVEKTFAGRLQRAIPSVSITQSHELGGLGLVERENAAILNAALRPLALRVCAGLADIVKSKGINCPLFVSKNDGTLAPLQSVQRFPALTFSSGPTNSIRGAGCLTGLRDAVVVDVGGTTTDIGVLSGGLPRMSHRIAEVGGVRTNFQMPDVVPLAVGGGSIVNLEEGTVGPRSVGHRLMTESRIAGGGTLTLTDLAVALGRMNLGKSAGLAELDLNRVRQIDAQVSAAVTRAAEPMLPGTGSMPIVLVGGGAALLGPEAMAGHEVRRPAHAGVANALGASQAEVSGGAECPVQRDGSYGQALERMTELAVARASAAGGDPEAYRVVKIEELAEPYSDTGGYRLRVKVVAPIAPESSSPQ